MIAAVVAVDTNYGIGNKNNLLVNIPEDMKMFKNITTGGTVVVGRKTYDTIPNKPLPNRTNIIVTSKVDRPKIQEDEAIHSNMEYIKTWLSNQAVINENNGIFVIGGGAIYKELLPYCERVYITKILHAFDEVDTYFPNIDEMPEWGLTSESEIKEYNGIKYQFCVYDRVDYEIRSIQIPDNSSDMVITVKTFNCFRTVILCIDDEGKISFYVDNWEYLYNEANLKKFIEQVHIYNSAMKMKEV